MKKKKPQMRKADGTLVTGVISETFESVSREFNLLCLAYKTEHGCKRLSRTVKAGLRKQAWSN